MTLLKSSAHILHAVNKVFTRLQSEPSRPGDGERERDRESERELGEVRTRSECEYACRTHCCKSERGVRAARDRRRDAHKRCPPYRSDSQTAINIVSCVCVCEQCFFFPMDPCKYGSLYFIIYRYFHRNLFSEYINLYYIHMLCTNISSETYTPVRTSVAVDQWIKRP